MNPRNGNISRILRLLVGAAAGQTPEQFIEQEEKLIQCKSGGYPPCVICGGPNDQAEVCPKCAKTNNPFVDLEKSGGFMVQDSRRF